MVVPGFAASNFVLALVKPAVSPALPPQKAKLMVPESFLELDVVVGAALLDADDDPEPAAAPVLEAAELLALDELLEAALDELVDELLDESLVLECTEEEHASSPSSAALPKVAERKRRRDTDIDTSPCPRMRRKPGIAIASRQ